MVNFLSVEDRRAASGANLGLMLLVGRLTPHCGPDWKKLVIAQWIVLEFGEDIHSALEDESQRPAPAAAPRTRFIPNYRNLKH